MSDRSCRSAQCAGYNARSPNEPGKTSPCMLIRRTPARQTGPLRARKIKAVIPERDDQKANRARKGSSGGRPPDFDPQQYKNRNQVERGFNRRKHWRALATRYDKLADSYQATLDLAETLDWLRAVPGRTP